MYSFGHGVSSSHQDSAVACHPCERSPCSACILGWWCVSLYGTHCKQSSLVACVPPQLDYVEGGAATYAPLHGLLLRLPLFLNAAVRIFLVCVSLLAALRGSMVCAQARVVWLPLRPIFASPYTHDDLGDRLVKKPYGRADSNGATCILRLCFLPAR